MYLRELPSEKIREIILSHDSLKNEFSGYLLESALEWCLDKLHDMHSVTYLLNGYREPDYVRTRQGHEDEFISDLKKYNSCYCMSDHLYKKLTYCESIRGTNLFNYHVARLCEQFYNEEIKPEMEYAQEYIDESNYAQYSDTIDCWLECYDYMYNEEDGTVYTDHRKYYN